MAITVAAGRARRSGTAAVSASRAQPVPGALSGAAYAPRVRGMADHAFRAEQLRRCHEGRVAPVNALVEVLNAERPQGYGPIPWAAPHDGGVEAVVLSLLSNPGPAAGGPGGSGFVSVENAAPSSQRMVRVRAAAGVAAEQVLVWNAVPWYVHGLLGGRTTAAMRTAGVEPLHRLLALLPRLRAVVLHGGDARDGWARLLRAHPGAGEGLAVVSTWHPSNQVFAVPPAERARREAHMVEAYRQALAAAGCPSAPSSHHRNT